MAYAALVSLAQTIDLIFNYHHHFISSPQLKDQVITIHDYVIFLQAFLEDFPDKANSFEGRIREVTLAAEDVIEFLFSKQIHDSFVGPSKSMFKDMERGPSQEERHESFVGSSKYILRCSAQFGSKPFIWGLSSHKHQTWKNYGHLGYNLYNLKKVAKEIESISEQVMEIKSRITVKDVRLGDSAAATSSSTVAPFHKEAMVGCDDDLMQMKLRLCGESSKLQVVPIVGMGGIGKTTLAINVYNDPYILEHFDVRVWVTVSQDYSIQEIVWELLVSMKVLDAKREPMEGHRVYQNLKGRRFLIVLDDLWSVKAWDDLKMMFPDDGNRSRIILTTRLSDVACYPDSYSPVHEMRLMDEDQSWNMLRLKVFKQDHCPIELEDVGKTISRSCRGLPLAIVVISGLLATVDRTKAAWENIAKDVKSIISANDEHLDKILSLSYTYLPHHLRPCFLYMAGFPEDLVMHASEIIKLWVAEGFLKPNRSKSFEETAEGYLEDLVKRSLILVTKWKSNGRIKNFSMHDLMREMCIKKAHEENFILLVHGSLQQGSEIPRRLTILHDDFDCLVKYGDSSIRTIASVDSKGEIGSSCCLGYFRLLRILNMSGVYRSFHPYLTDDSLPAEMFELFHLRYLALDLSRFTIPAAISNLQNLQTLIITDKFPSLSLSVKLPEEIWRMPQLRHIIAYRCDLPITFEGDVLAQENLQTLAVARNFVCSLKILKVIPNLKKLGLRYERLGDEDICEVDYELQNLVYLQRLEKLKVEMDYNFRYRQKVSPVFPRTLKKLTLSCLGVPWNNMKIVGSLPNLQVLKLRFYACDGDTWETTEGEFPQLKFLLIDRSIFGYWITESNHFPRLECLVLHNLLNLREIPDGIGEIPTLKVIEVSGDALVKSAKQIQYEQLSNGDDALKVRVIRH